MKIRKFHMMLLLNKLLALLKLKEIDLCLFSKNFDKEAYEAVFSMLVSLE